MLTLKVCALYPEGERVDATMRARSAKGRYRIEYRGTVKRMGDMPAWANPAALELLFTTAVHHGEIGCGVSATGEYEVGPKYRPNDRLMEVQRNRLRYKLS